MKTMTFPSEQQFNRFLAMFDREIKVVFMKVKDNGQCEVGLKEVENEPSEQSIFKKFKVTAPVNSK